MPVSCLRRAPVSRENLIMAFGYRPVDRDQQFCCRRICGSGFRSGIWRGL
jgi:hypothetical protein